MSSSVPSRTRRTRFCRSLRSIRRLAPLALLAVAALPSDAQGIHFVDVADPAHGITYRRGPSPDDAISDQIRARGTTNKFDVLLGPIKERGAPGVALLDFDRDGDLDLYVTNGPGRPNSLYSNQLRETGAIGFRDVAREVGAALTAHDSTGVCFGDIDNDGDPDLYVLGAGVPNHLLENRGGRFVDVTGVARVGGGTYHHSACAMGDVDGDGRLDLFVGNTFDWVSKAAIMLEPYDLNEPNQLFLNRGRNRFEDVSATAGINGARHDITWAVAMFDYDQDGDLDLFAANDQGAIPTANYGGLDRGFLRLYENDGRAHFTDVTERANLDEPESNMGFAVADYDGDGTLDMAISNIGDYIEPFFGIPYTLGDQTQRWWLNNGDGSFRDPGVGPDLIASGWSWGISPLDYDNDGDVDFVGLGGFDMSLIVDASNPGPILVNDGFAHFTADLALAADHSRRNDHGVAVGDLDGNGFEDIVSVSTANRPDQIPFVLYPFNYDCYLDGRAGFGAVWTLTGNGDEARYGGHKMADGSLAIELNQGGSGHGFVDVELAGSVGLASGARVNRDGIGAIVRFTPAGGRTTTRTVLGGSSLASQDALAIHFGAGAAPSGTVDVVWPGSRTRNRLYDVQAGERIRFPEIPCSIDTPGRRGQYAKCVDRALFELRRAKRLTRAEATRFRASALRAFDDER